MSQTSLLRRAVRDTAYRLAVVTGYSARRRERSRGAVVFAFHNVVPGEGEGPLHLPLVFFERVVAWMAARFVVIPLRELARRARDGRPLGGLAAITFDDAYGGVFRHALPALAARGLPATVFVVSGAADRPRPFWWDVLDRQGGLSEPVRERCLRDLDGDRTRVLEHFAPRGAIPLTKDLWPASWAEIRAARGSRAGLDLESHTVTHRNLARLSPEELRAELRDSREAIGRELGREATLLAYPYGLHSPEVVAAARREGYAAGVTVDHGSLAPGDDPLRIARVDVPAGITLDALDCWASGLRPGSRA